MLRYDLTGTFDVVVGKGCSSQRFTVHSNVLTSRSSFFKAARKPEWLTDPTKPTDLQDEEPEVFSRYMNCVYFGIKAFQLSENIPKDDRDDKERDDKLGSDAFLCSEAEHAAVYKEEPGSNYCDYLRQCFRILIDLYLLADRLRDLKTANLVMDELVRFGNEGESYSDEIIRRVYGSTVHGNPLRKLMRDDCVYETDSVNYMRLHVEGGHPDFARDVMVEFLRLRDHNATRKVENVYSLHDNHRALVDKCHYHQHDKDHPRCVPAPGSEEERE